MTRTLRFLGITVVALALTGAIAIAISTRVDTATTASTQSARVAPDPSRAGIEAPSLEVDRVVSSRADSRRAQPVGARIDALLTGAAPLVAALLALGAVATAARRSTPWRGLAGFRRRAPPLLLSV